MIISFSFQCNRLMPSLLETCFSLKCQCVLFKYFPPAVSRPFVMDRSRGSYFFPLLLVSLLLVSLIESTDKPLRHLSVVYRESRLCLVRGWAKNIFSSLYGKIE